MAHPKRKISKQRRDKRRNNYKLEEKYSCICPITGLSHLPHRAYIDKGDLYYRGNLVLKQYINKKIKKA